MSRKKGKSKAKGTVKSTPRRTPLRHYPSHSPLAQEPTTPKLSLADEARWMSNYRTGAFEVGKKLRHMPPIQFISAGRLEGTIPERLSVVQDGRDSSRDDSLTPSLIASSATPDNTEALSQMAIRSPSPTPTQASSSADEVVFRGRGPCSKDPVDSVPTLSTITSSVITPNSAVQDAADKASHHVTSQCAAVSTQRPFLVGLDMSVQANTTPERDGQSDGDAVEDTVFAKRRGGRPAWEGTSTPWESRSKPGAGWLPVRDRPDMDALIQSERNSRDAAMDDYMQNMEKFGLTDDMLAASGFSRREIDLDNGSHNDWESASGDQDEEQEDDIQGNDSWNSDTLQDFDDLSTSSDAIDTVVRILSKRMRKSGLHYLCVYEGSGTDDARWLPSSLLQSHRERQVVQAFEQEALFREEQQNTSNDSADDEAPDEDEEEDSEEEFDDETIARVLQKQEELGLGSGEILLYAGDEFFDGPITTYDPFTDPVRPNKKRQARTRENRGPTFPSASAMADALSMDPYGGFDIMDTERPSLRPKKGGRRGCMPPELEDEQLHEQLQKAWAADREKKRLKKAEREELRQQGLLGRRGKSANLKVKYQGGIVMEDVVDEIREFVMGDMQSLSLPPMEANRRAAVHQVAAFFNLTSRSRGDGHDRFTVLFKTTRTRTWTDDEFDIAVQRKGFQKRLRGPLHSQGGSRSSRTAVVRHGNRVRPRTGYQDGDTVGANAPELGPGNKGHALLSRMGWSKGMGLGAADNKGILQPITHTVKINRAGL